MIKVGLSQPNFCKEKYWIFNKIDHEVILRILGQDKFL